MKNLFNGLMGYYFDDEYFSNVNLIASTTDILDFEKSDLPELCLNQKVKTVRWIGHVKPTETGEYILSTNCSNCIIQVDDKLLASSSPKLNTINLESGKIYKIRIEQNLPSEKLLKDYEGVTLYWESDSIEKQIVPKDSLLNPDFSDVNEDNEFIPNNNFFCIGKNRAANDTIDSDRDGIPDNLEINGYTVINLKVLPWKDEYANQGYKKYVSNPYSARTANDPYTDYEKVSGRIDPSVAIIARDPMIAACPIVGVQMEKLVVSKNSTITGQAGTSMSKATNNSSTYSNTVGASVSGSVNIGLFPTFSMSASANYSHTWSNTSSVTDTTGQSFSQGLSINTGESAYINPNVRYYNSGTAPVYDVSPNTTIVINDESVATIQANANDIGSYLNPQNYYPRQGLAPLALNTMDQFSSRLIPINYEQLKTIDNGGNVTLSTAQFNGNFAKLDINGNLVTTNNNWGPYLGTIESTTASLVLDMHGTAKQVRVAACNPKVPTDSTPKITLRQSIKKAFDIEEVNGKVFFEGMEIPRTSEAVIYLDKYTETDFADQLKNSSDKNYLDCILKPNMHILIVVKKRKFLKVGFMDFMNGTEENIISKHGLDNVKPGDFDKVKRANTNKYDFTLPNMTKGKYMIKTIIQCNYEFNMKTSINSNYTINKNYPSGFIYIEDYFNFDTNSPTNCVIDVSLKNNPGYITGIFKIEIFELFE